MTRHEANANDVGFRLFAREITNPRKNAW